jgi:hypothetical protein
MALEGARIREDAGSRYRQVEDELCGEVGVRNPPDPVGAEEPAHYRFEY